MTVPAEHAHEEDCDSTTGKLQRLSGRKEKRPLPLLLRASTCLFRAEAERAQNSEENCQHGEDSLQLYTAACASLRLQPLDKGKAVSTHRVRNSEERTSHTHLPVSAALQLWHLVYRCYSTAPCTLGCRLPQSAVLPPAPENVPARKQDTPQPLGAPAASGDRASPFSVVGTRTASRLTVHSEATRETGLVMHYFNRGLGRLRCAAPRREPR